MSFSFSSLPPSSPSCFNAKPWSLDPLPRSSASGVRTSPRGLPDSYWLVVDESYPWKIDILSFPHLCGRNAPSLVLFLPVFGQRNSRREQTRRAFIPNDRVSRWIHVLVLSTRRASLGHSREVRVTCIGKPILFWVRASRVRGLLACSAILFGMAGTFGRWRVPLASAADVFFD